jgi:hypothetical protein
MKENKKLSVERKKEIIANKPKPKPAKGHHSRAVHDAKGRNQHGRTAGRHDPSTPTPVPRMTFGTGNFIRNVVEPSDVHVLFFTTCAGYRSSPGPRGRLVWLVGKSLVRGLSGARVLGSCGLDLVV